MSQSLAQPIGRRVPDGRGELDLVSRASPARERGGPLLAEGDGPGKPTLLAELADWVARRGGDSAEITVVLGTTLAVAGRLDEGCRLLWAAMQARDERLPAGLVADAVAWHARSSRLLGRYERACAVVEEHLAALGGHAEPDLHGLRLELGSIALCRGRVDAEWERRTGGYAIHADLLTRAQLLGQLALVLAGRQRPHEALELVGTAGRLADRAADRPADDVTRVLEALYWLAEAERSLGLDERAAEHFGRALEISDLSGHEYLRGYLSVGLGRVLLRRGAVDAAATCADRAERSAGTALSDLMRAAAYTLRSQIHVAVGDPATATEVATAAVDLAAPFGGNWARYAQRCLGRARSALGPRPVPDPQARPAGRTPVPPVQRALPADEHGAAAPPGGVLNTLSRRETEIASLVSAGRTNQQIANALTLSPKTVETYLARIFKKLGITSRTSIAHLVGLTGSGLRQQEAR